MVDGGGTVVALGAYTGLRRDADQPSTARFAHVWQEVDGVVHFEQVADTAQLARR